MIELKDNLNWHDFQASFMPEEWYRRKEGENVLKWLKRTGINDSRWKEEALFRENNDYWIHASTSVIFKLLRFMREEDFSQEELEDLLGFELDFKSPYDFRLSELKKLEEITGLCFLKNI